MSSPNNYSQTYLKKINTELNSIINYAKRFYDLNTNPCGKAGTIGKAKAEEMDYWTYDEYIAFREGVKDKSLSYICFEVLYWTGMREGELLALSPADIDLDNKTISINRTYQRIEGKDVFTSPKTRKSKRKIPIPDFLCQELSNYIQSRYMLDADERLFPVTKSYLSHEMIRGCKNTDVKKIRIHDIRHSHASLLINQGCDAVDVSRQARTRESIPQPLTHTLICFHINSRSLCIVWNHCRQQIRQHLNHHLITLCLKQ